jgi:gas vesicle protein
MGDARGWFSDIGESARKWTHQAADQVANTASQTSDQAHSALGRTLSGVAGSVQSLVDRARDYADHAQGHANATTEDLTNHANSLYGRAKSSALRRTGLQEAHPYRSAAGHTFGTVGVLALGAGLMYMFDPAKGRARRAWARDKFFSVARKTNKSVSQYGRHMSNKVQGAVAQAKNAMPEDISQVLDHAAESAAAVVSHHGEHQGKPM